jgi:hypothetical protein
VCLRSVIINVVKLPVKPRILHNAIFYDVFRNKKFKALVISVIKLPNALVDTVAPKKIRQGSEVLFSHF